LTAFKAYKGQILAVHLAQRAVLLSCVSGRILNLMHLSGIATLDTAVCNAIQGQKHRVLDTRKDGSGLRALEKYAVLCAVEERNHRLDLSSLAF